MAVEGTALLIAENNPAQSITKICRDLQHLGISNDLTLSLNALGGLVQTCCGFCMPVMRVQEEPMKEGQFFCWARQALKSVCLEVGELISHYDEQPCS